MRKIERLMLAAIEQRKDWRLDNTEVQCVYFDHSNPAIDRVNVKLHGHTIAVVTPDNVDICDCGYQTATTKSRLNAILRALCNGAGVYQSSFKWYGVATGKSIWEIEPETTHCFPRDN
jgi:hypothetical protein